MHISKILSENIDKTFHLSLGTSVDGKPWVSEVHFAYDNAFNLYYRSLPSRRHSIEITSNPNVAGDIIKQHSLEEAVTGLYFEGTAKKLTLGKDLDTAFEVLHNRLGVTTDALKEAVDPEGHQFYKITVEKWYAFGNFAGNGSAKITLS